MSSSEFKNKNRILQDILKQYGGFLPPFFLLITILIACYPLCNTGLPGGYYKDLGYHLIRIEGVKEALLNHTYPPRIYDFALNGYGYGSPMFYQDWLFIIPATFRLMGVGIRESYRLFVIIVITATAITSFYTIRKIIRNDFSAVITTMMLILSQYYLADLYDRSGISEYLTFIFIPILLLGLYYMTTGAGKYIHCIGIGLVGVMMCHSITFVLCVILTVTVIGCSLPMLIRNKELFGRLIITGILSVMISAFIYMPLIEQMNSGDFVYKHPWAHIGEMGEPIRSFLRTWGTFSTIAYVGIGLPVILCLLLRFTRVRNDNKWIDICIFTGGLLLLVSTEYFPWEIFEGTPVESIQFPYRLYTIAIPILTIGAGMMYEEFTMRYKALRVPLFLILSVLTMYYGYKQDVATAYAEETEAIDDDYFSHPENTIYIGAGEWLPRGASVEGVMSDYYEDKVLCKDTGELIDGNREYNSLDFESSHGKAEYSIPKLYYKGYRAELVETNGDITELVIGKDNDNASRTSVIKATESTGKVRVYYEGTMIQKLSVWISGLTASILVIHIIRSKLWKRKRILTTE